MPLNRKQLISTGILTTGCLGTFFALRAVPVEPCDFLHYGDFVNAEGVIEGCGYEEVGFFDLTTLRFPVLAEVTPLTELRPGHEAVMQLSLKTTTGRTIAFEDIAVSHTERVHAMIVDPSLEDYQHLHPTDGGMPGTYTFTFTPERAGEYSVFLDFIPLQNSRRTLLQTRFTVAGDTQPVDADAQSLAHRSGDFLYRLVPEDNAPFTAGEVTRFSLEVEARGAEEVVFEPVMDSFAHIVAFEASRSGFAHFHPENPFIDGQDPRNPELDFVFSVEDPGHYRVWAQVAINGQERFVPFDLQVRPQI